MKIKLYDVEVDLSTYTADDLQQLVDSLVMDIEHYSNYNRVDDYDETKETLDQVIEFILYFRK